MQLVAYGAQDVYLTGNPQITFFKVVYRRHTNFSMESIQQTWNGVSDSSGRCTATISRNGDLVHRMYIVLDGQTTGAGNNPGSQWITNVEIEIGGQRIDKHSAAFLETYAELTQSNPSGTVGTVAATMTTPTLFQKMSGMGGVIGVINTAVHFEIPLQFWFCRNPGLALPLIALQYHEVKVILDHQIDAYYDTNQTQSLWADYIYLDTDERRRFAQVSHEYLIEQVQEQALNTGDTSTELHFNHPVKELIWVADGHDNGGDGQDTLRTVGTNTTNYQLKLNGHDRFAARRMEYFTRAQVLQHHSGAGGLDSDTASAGQFNDSIAVYSFALKPEEHQPSGTCNFSRIDSAQLAPSGGNNIANKIFAVNYNVLRIMSGMGGLAYSN